MLEQTHQPQGQCRWPAQERGRSSTQIASRARSEHCFSYMIATDMFALWTFMPSSSVCGVFSGCIMARKEMTSLSRTAPHPRPFGGRSATISRAIFARSILFPSQPEAPLSSARFGSTKNDRSRHNVELWGVGATLGRPKSVRAVRSANGANPVAIVVPCHRVIGADGSLTGYGGDISRNAGCSLTRKSLWSSLRSNVFQKRRKSLKQS